MHVAINPRSSKTKGEIMDDRLENDSLNGKLGDLLAKSIEHKRVSAEVTSFEEFLNLSRSEPWITRNSTQLLHDMMLSRGVEHSMVAGKPVRHTYRFFEEKEMVGPYIVFGQQKAKENMIEKIHNASRGLEANKRLWILLGPPGSAKSRSMDGIKLALNTYSKSDEGKTFFLLLPTVDERLKEKALFTENDIYYLPAPLFETPLLVIPPSIREEFAAELTESIDKQIIGDWLDKHPHYDNTYKVKIDGMISPYADYVLNDFMRAKDLDFRGLIPYLKVKRMIFDARTKTGIGSYTPRDEKSQEAGSLVGNIDYSLLPRFGSESHPLVHDYKGELCAGANGFVEIHEILKLSDKFLYELLFATQDRFFKPEGQAPIPFNGVIIGHTNFHEFNMFMGNPSFEALRSRTTFIEMPLSVDYKQEEQIYAFTYSNETRDWHKEKKHQSHIAPHSLAFLSLVVVMSRLYESKTNENLSLLQKALVYAGRADSGVDNNMAKMVLEEFDYVKPSEGTFGLDPRFIQNVVEYTEHFQISEYAANINRLKEETGDHALLTSVALQNPCVTPLDLHVHLENALKDRYAIDKTKLRHYVEKITPLAKSWIFGQVASDVYSAILRDDSVIETTWKKYTDHVRAFAHSTKVKHDVTQMDVQPDEKFMQAIEQYLGVPDREVFRKELSDAIASVKFSVLLSDEPSYQNAIKKYVFENEFKASENMKLLGWIKSGTSAANVNVKEQEHLNETIKYLIDMKGYCGKCAFQALSITANAASIIT
jgi:serine protein kinase